MIYTSSKLSSVLVAALLSAFALRAADDGAEWSVKGGLVNPQGDLRTLTKNAVGFGGELGFDILPTKDAGVGFGFHAGFLSAKGKRQDFETHTAKATHGGVDLIYALGQSPLTIRTGLELVSWDVTSLKPKVGTGAQGETTWKFGFRAGGEFRFNKQWSLTAMYSFSQWKSDTDANIAVNPSFVSLMAGYKF